MASLTQDRNTPRRGTPFMVADTVAAAIMAGAMYTLDASGAAKPAVAADKKPVRAVCVERADAGSELVKGERAVFCFENSAGAAEIKRADIGSNAYAADDHTVSKTGSCIAGEVIDIDDFGVWVAIGTAAVPTTA
ncbi:hypothetical protein SR914_23385 [Comamonas testosteroni]|uniref:Phage protein n=1 Tax=Comamonas testosteroni (strain DSM 14576 / KF-1) TaxID=399795 RepID=B7WXV1_COMTK|nr:hypothetical protein [Comamonas testosteroni]EED67953.1 conserved hypothetical protein [Comamonas testosteroni KF-1]WQG66071.1 hypothetical protein SR914_23385 [Comamonas testosteroni]